MCLTLWCIFAGFMCSKVMAWYPRTAMELLTPTWKWRFDLSPDRYSHRRCLQFVLNLAREEKNVPAQELLPQHSQSRILWKVRVHIITHGFTLTNFLNAVLKLLALSRAQVSSRYLSGYNYNICGFSLSSALSLFFSYYCCSFQRTGMELGMTSSAKRW